MHYTVSISLPNIYSVVLFHVYDNDNRLSSQQKLVSTTDQHVTDFAGTGSRTLVFGGRTLPKEEFDNWFQVALYAPNRSIPVICFDDELLYEWLIDI
jgi:hypothetical protein